MTLALAADEIASIFDGQAAVWIQVKDVGANKTYPRQRFTYVPYAMHVPVDGTTLDYNALGQLKVLTVPTTGVSSVTPGTGLTGSTSNGAVTLRFCSTLRRMRARGSAFAVSFVPPALRSSLPCTFFNQFSLCPSSPQTWRTDPSCGKFVA